MNSNIQFWNDKLSELLTKCEKSFYFDLNGIRSNRISTDFLKNVTVSTRDEKTILARIAILSSTSTKDLVVTVFDKSNVQSITKALLDSNVGLKLDKTNGENIYLSLIPTTEEVRRKLISKCKEELEKTKVSVRNIRQRIFSEIKNSDCTNDQKKKIEKALDQLIGIFNKKLTKVYESKVSELESL